MDKDDKIYSRLYEENVHITVDKSNQTSNNETIN